MLSKGKKPRHEVLLPAPDLRMPAVLLDRDGTLIREVGYLSRVEQIELLPRVPDAIRLLRQNGLKVAVVTNQSAVARGFLSEKELGQIHQELRSLLAKSGAFLDGIYYCPHHPTEGLRPYRIACECRKPNVGLTWQAAEELNLNLSRSYVVGDQAIDMELALRIGAKGILIANRGAEIREQAAETEELVVKDFLGGTQWIVRDLSAQR